MTPEELDKARAKEARRIWDSSNGLCPISPAQIAARLAREGWTPPPPVDPDVLVVREIVAVEWEKWCAEHQVTKHYGAKFTRSGRCDHDHSFRAALAAYKAGREAEAERAKVLVAALDDMQKNSMTVWSARASAALAAYKAGKEAGK